MRKGYLALAVVVAGVAGLAQERHVLPAGAASAGFVKCVLEERPRAADISPDGKGKHKWYSGTWATGARPGREKYKTVDGALCIEAGGEVATAPFDLRGAHGLPYISGRDGFYVEVEYSLSDNDKGNLPVVAVLPRERNARKECVYPGSPKGFEHWMELYVDEGNPGQGMSGTVWNRWGVEGVGYHFEKNGNNVQWRKIDRSKRHTYGASYNPRKGAVYWWLDNRFSHGASWAAVPDVGARQNFYIVVRAKERADGKPYKMYVHGVRVYVPAGAKQG